MLLFNTTLFYSISVVKASSHCLRDILSTSSGAGVLNKLEQSVSHDANQWFNVLEPFKQYKKKVMLDVSDLWTDMGQ